MTSAMNSPAPFADKNAADVNNVEYLFFTDATQL